VKVSGWKAPARYDSVVRIASGGMGDVYRAVDSSLGRTVALKVLAERHSRDAEVRARFTREGHAAARLSTHPHVVTVFDVGEHDGRPYIVMEYLEGGSVHDRIRSSRVPLPTALEWLRQTASALDAAHAGGVVHRDVKPANLLLDDEACVHVTDFGIASATGQDTLTLPGTIMGTAGYLSPEQARGEQATAASDRYALGVVAFELLTGQRPFEGETPVTVALAHVNAEIPSAKLAKPSLPAGVDAVLRRALAKEPRDRPATATELVEELREAVHDAEPTTVVGPVVAPPHVTTGAVTVHRSRPCGA
jgi:serine/threonine-protein kinase